MEEWRCGLRMLGAIANATFSAEVSVGMNLRV